MNLRPIAEHTGGHLLGRALCRRGAFVFLDPSNEGRGPSEQCIVEWLNANPTFSLAGRCAWCGKAETPIAKVLPFGAGEHREWLAAECWALWYQRRREEAVLALREMGIAPSGSLERLP